MKNFCPAFGRSDRAADFAWQRSKMKRETGRATARKERKIRCTTQRVDLPPIPSISQQSHSKRRRPLECNRLQLLGAWDQDPIRR